MDLTAKQRLLKRAAALIGRDALAARPDRKLFALADLIDTLGEPKGK